MPQLPGTARMLTYPGHPDPCMAIYHGIDYYGFVFKDGIRAYKVPARNVPQLLKLGYRYVGGGTSYAYVAKPKRGGE